MGLIHRLTVSAMSLSLCIVSFLVPFLILGTSFTARNSPSESLYLQISRSDQFGKANDHHIIQDHLKHASLTTLWGEGENEMENPLGHEKSDDKVGVTRGRKLEIAAGSRLPDCLHACGSCSPCSLVMVSLTCALHVDDSESCPVSYRCTCKSKSYPIP